MNRSLLYRGRFWPTLTLSVIAAGAAIAYAQPTLVDPNQPPVNPPVAATENVTPANNEQVEVVTRGPVHEAFAESLQVDTKNQLVVEKKPPDPIEEVPPEVRPEGDNVVWVPGYWAWDDDRKDFLWISGIWRSSPPNRNWVPGYWAQTTNGGWLWTPGFWAQAQAQQLEYLPEPPASLDNGPPETTVVKENEYWVPGCWVWRETRYAWRPGYYTVVNPDWVWIPDHYVWTPSGYVYIAGYWDYPIARRGIVFAPVYFHEPVYLHTSYYWRPAIVVETNLISTHLWYRPACYHYYFGDYYGASYVSLGFTPWYVSYHHHHDPLFAYYRATRGPQWAVNVEVGHHFYAQYSDYRPPHTFAAHAEWSQRIASKPLPQVVNVNNKQVNITNVNTINVTNVKVAQNIHDVGKRGQINNVKLQSVSADTQQQLATQVKGARTTQMARAQTEIKAPIAKTQPVAGFDLSNKNAGAATVNSNQPNKFGQKTLGKPGFGQNPTTGNVTNPTGAGNAISTLPGTGGLNTGNSGTPGGRRGNQTGGTTTPGTQPLTTNPPGHVGPTNPTLPKGTVPTNPLTTNPTLPKGTIPGTNPAGGGEQPKIINKNPITTGPGAGNPGTGNPGALVPRTLPGTGGQPGTGGPPSGGPPRTFTPRGTQPKDTDKDKGKKTGAIVPPPQLPATTAPSFVERPKLESRTVVPHNQPVVQPSKPVVRSEPKSVISTPPTTRGAAKAAITAPQPNFQKSVVPPTTKGPATNPANPEKDRPKRGFGR